VGLIVSYVDVVNELGLESGFRLELESRVLVVVLLLVECEARTVVVGAGFDVERCFKVCVRTCFLVLSLRVVYRGHKRSYCRVVYRGHKQSYCRVRRCRRSAQSAVLFGDD
jgi:hypothetical protein